MAEVTHTSEAPPYRMLPGKGRGTRLWAGKIALAATADTLDTGLDTIEAVVVSIVEATSPTSVLKYVGVQSVSAGTVTFNSTSVTLTEATDANRVMATSTNSAYVIVVGTSRGL